MKSLPYIAWVLLLAAMLALLVKSGPVFTLFGAVAVAISLVVLVVLAVTGTARAMRDAFAAHVLRNEDFHWY